MHKKLRNMYKNGGAMLVVTSAPLKTTTSNRLPKKLRAANVRGKNIAVLIVFVSRQIVSSTRNMSTLDMARYVVGPSYPVLMLMNWSMIP